MPSEHDSLFRHLTTSLKYLAAASSLVFIVLFATLAVLRAQYPFELEWMEGAMADHVARILNGLPLYTEPTIEFVTYRYTPLYFFAAAAVSKIIGFSLLPLRAISIVSSLAAFTLLFLFVRRETGKIIPGLIAAGLFAAAFPITGAFYDLARVDSLFIILLLAAAYLFRSGQSWRTALFAGLFLGLAFLTKQATGPVGLFLIAYAALTRWRFAAVSLLSTVIIAGGVTLLYNLASHGWYYYYTFELGTNIFPTEGALASLRKVFIDDLLHAFPVAAILASAALIDLMIREDRRTAWFYLAFTTGMVAITFIARIHPGGWTNTLIPACAVIALLFGIAVGRLDSAADHFRTLVRRSALVSLYLIVILQMVVLFYNPAKHLPSAEDRQAGYQLIERVKSFSGDVFIPYHGYLATLAGKQSWAHFQAIRDVWSSTDHQDITRSMMDTICHAILEKRFDAIILDGDFFQKEVESAYTPGSPIFEQRHVFYPKAGWAVRPDRLYVPKDPAAGTTNPVSD